jgi:hypothetical protein
MRCKKNQYSSIPIFHHSNGEKSELIVVSHTEENSAAHSNKLFYGWYIVIVAFFGHFMATGMAFYIIYIITCTIAVGLVFSVKRPVVGR